MFIIIYQQLSIFYSFCWRCDAIALSHRMSAYADKVLSWMRANWLHANPPDCQKPCDAHWSIVSTRYQTHRHKPTPQTCCYFPRSVTLACTSISMSQCGCTQSPLWDHVSQHFDNCTACNNTSHNTPCRHSSDLWSSARSTTDVVCSVFWTHHPVTPPPSLDASCRADTIPPLCSDIPLSQRYSFILLCQHHLQLTLRDAAIFTRWHRQL